MTKPAGLKDLSPGTLPERAAKAHTDAVMEELARKAKLDLREVGPGPDPSPEPRPRPKKRKRKNRKKHQEEANLFAEALKYFDPAPPGTFDPKSGQLIAADRREETTLSPKDVARWMATGEGDIYIHPMFLPQGVNDMVRHYLGGTPSIGIDTRFLKPRQKELFRGLLYRNSIARDAFKQIQNPNPGPQEAVAKP